MAQWLFTLRAGRPAMLTEGPTEAEAAAVLDHFAYLQRLVAEGTVLLVGRTQDAGPATRGLVIFEARDEAEARAVMEGDPAVQRGVMTATLQPFAIALAGRVEPRP